MKKIITFMMPNGLKIWNFKIGSIGPEPKKTEPIRKDPFEFGSYWVRFLFGSFYKITDLNRFYLISIRTEPCPPLLKASNCATTSTTSLISIRSVGDSIEQRTPILTVTTKHSSILAHLSALERRINNLHHFFLHCDLGIFMES